MIVNRHALKNLVYWEGWVEAVSVSLREEKIGLEKVKVNTGLFKLLEETLSP